MRQAMHHSHTIRTPIRRALDYNKIRRAISFEEDRAEQDYGKLETETGLTQDQIDSILNNRCTTISLGATACEDSEVTLGDTLSNGDDSPAEGYMVTEEHRLMREKLCILGKQEQDIIRARFGLGQEPETLEVIANRYNISRERIRQIETQALTKLRREMGKLTGKKCPARAFKAASETPVEKLDSITLQAGWIKDHYILLTNVKDKVACDGPVRIEFDNWNRTRPKTSALRSGVGFHEDVFRFYSQNLVVHLPAHP